jgi:ornithine--oxo-acid transaminase
MNSGSEAVDLAIKISRKWGYEVKGIEADNAMVVTITGNYHGKTLGPLSASSNNHIRDGFGPYIPGVGPFIDGRNIRFSNIEDLEFVFERHGDRIAAVILECVQGYAGCLPAEQGYLKAAYTLCKKHNALFVADEIQAGFGRTGYLMSYQAAGIKPDMITLGKALTGGVYSMSMVLGCKEAMSLLQYGQYVFHRNNILHSLTMHRHSSTFSGNPLACAVASEAINVIIDERLSERSLRLGTELKRRLESIKSPFTTVSATGRGLFLCIYIDESHPSGRVTAHRLCALMRRRGVLAYSYSNRIRIAPPLVIEEADLWRGIGIIEKSLNELVVIEGDIV